jgi:hypothetical protein
MLSTLNFVRRVAPQLIGKRGGSVPLSSPPTALKRLDSGQSQATVAAIHAGVASGDASEWPGA